MSQWIHPWPRIVHACIRNTQYAIRIRILYEEKRTKNVYHTNILGGRIQFGLPPPLLAIANYYCSLVQGKKVNWYQNVTFSASSPFDQTHTFLFWVVVDWTSSGATASLSVFFSHIQQQSTQIPLWCAPARFRSNREKVSPKFFWPDLASNLCVCSITIEKIFHVHFVVSFIANIKKENVPSPPSFIYSSIRTFVMCVWCINVCVCVYSHDISYAKY